MARTEIIVVVFLLLPTPTRAKTRTNCSKSLGRACNVALQTTQKFFSCSVYQPNPRSEHCLNAFSDGFRRIILRSSLQARNSKNRPCEVCTRTHKFGTVLACTRVQRVGTTFR